jgi:hypothetical protein
MVGLGTASHRDRGNWKISKAARRTLWAAFICLLAAPLGLATPAVATLGELLMARDTTVDETMAISGLTVLNGSRIKTSENGSAILNLGQLGRITLGSEAELVLEASDNAIRGELVSGWMILNAPQGVDIAIKTADGLASSDGKRASLLRVDRTQGTTRVETNGYARLLAGPRSEPVNAGEEVELSQAAEGAQPVISRRAIEASANAPAENIAGFGGIFASSLRAAVESVTLNHTLVPAPSSSSPSISRDSGDVSVIAQQVTCPDFGCPDCRLFPQLVKAKAGCTLSFIAHFENVPVTSRLSVRPFFSSACFRIFPGYPQVITIPTGGSYNFQINANNCTRTQTLQAANQLLVFESNTCGTKYVQVEWATPCR